MVWDLCLELLRNFSICIIGLERRGSKKNEHHRCLAMAAFPAVNAEGKGILITVLWTLCSFGCTGTMDLECIANATLSTSPL